MSAAQDSRFSFTQDQLRTFVRDALDHARRLGASSAEIDVSEGFGKSVTVRRGEVETIEYNRDKGLGVTAYIGQRKGHASTSDLAPEAIRETVAAAINIARFTAPDPCAGLPDASRLARESGADYDLFHPWDISVDESIDLARRCEDAAFAVSPQITNSEGATVSVQQAQFCAANSLGFEGGYATTRHYVACSVIAGENDGMQRDDWYSTARDPRDLGDGAAIGDYAARRALSRLDARKVKTCQVPVIFEAPLAASLIGNFVHAASGGALYRQTSFLVDQLGKKIFSPVVHISERPHLKKGLATSPFDDDGVATRDREVVEDGILRGYFLSTYTGRKLGMPTTGNAGGSHNLIVRSGRRNLDGLIKDMGKGLLVTELLGQGVNYVNGDYSRGAAGYWVENGKIAYPVEEITIAGNLRDMFRGIADIGNDVVVRGSKQCGSILINRMKIAGA